MLDEYTQLIPTDTEIPMTTITPKQLRDMYAPPARAKTGKFKKEMRCDGCAKPVRDDEAFCDEWATEKHLTEGYVRLSGGTFLGGIVCNRNACVNKLPEDVSARAKHYDRMRAKFNPA